MTRALRDIPAVRALAEREARAFYDHAFSDHDDCGFSTLRGSVRAKWIEAFLKRLTDLTRRASFLAVLDLVAAQLKLDTSGGVILTPTAHRRAKVRDWIVEDWNGATAVVLTASKITNPAEALAIIADAVLT